MKRLLLVSGLIFLVVNLSLAQKRNDMPRVEVKSLKGKMVSAPSLLMGKPTIVSFWATWCKPCVKELDAIQDVLPDWREDADFNLIAISVDDSRSEHRVAPFVKGRGWEFPVFLDANSDLMRALNAATVPHTFLYDEKGKLVWQHSGYSVGDEDELFEQLLEITEK